MEISKIIDDIEIASPNDIENYLLNISKYILSKTEVINKLSSKKIENESQLKNYIIDNSENIITIFSLIKTLKEEFSISKRSFETMSNQMLILKKKYIEPFEKLKRSITNKTNIDNVITLYDNIKSFRNEVKIIHNHFLQDTLTLSDSNFDLYIKLKRYPLSQFIGINYIKDDLEWFNRNDENILNKFRSKFEDAIINKDNNMILQFFEFFTRLDLLVTEIKNFSNKVLKELMVDNFLAKIIRGSINTTNDINDIDNITKIRNILSQFFLNLENYSLVFENLGSLLKTSYDKKRFVLYENIMEIEDLQDINGLFIDKIFSSIHQIMEKIKKNSKFINSYNYFIKDFLFFYFCMKKFYSVCNFADKSKKDLLLESIEDIKNSFIDKFKTSINENFTRAFTLVKNIEKNAEMNGQFEKENIVNVHIIEHLVDYMKKIGQSFTDLYDIFYIEDDELFYSPKDKLITQLRKVFANEIINNYFSSIFSKLDEVTDKLKNFTETNEKLLIQKFFYFYYLLYKMNDVFISFINSNINYLVDSELFTKIKDKMYIYLSSFYSIFINRMTLKVLLLNKDDFKYYNEYIQSLIKDITLFFSNENYNSNRAYEKPIMKFIIYIYSLSTILLLMMNCETDFESYDALLQHLTRITGIFFRLNSIDFILKLHETAKMLSKISTENDLNAIYNKDTSSKLKVFLFQLRKISIGDMNIVKYCAEKKLSLEQFAKICGLILTRYLKINSEELKDKVSQNQIDEIESYIINF